MAYHCDNMIGKRGKRCPNGLARWPFSRYHNAMNDISVSRRGFITGMSALAGTFALPAEAAIGDTALVNAAKAQLDRLGRKIWLSDVVGLADFSRPSYEPRFFIVDMVAGKVRPFLVSHGSGSDPDHTSMLQSFSNEPGSNATSRGAYLTHTWYQGMHGTSMRLSGLDADNHNAEPRAIVVHGAAYANPSMIGKWGKLGRSQGCFAFPQADLMEILARLGPGRLIFADRLAPAV